MPRAEVVDNLLHGCGSRNPSKARYYKLRQVDYSSLPLRCLDCRKRKRDGHNLSHAETLFKPGSAIVEATVRKQQTLLTSFVYSYEWKRSAWGRGCYLGR